MARDFYKWLRTFTNTIRTSSYWVDWQKVLKNVEIYKDELNILNGLIGSKDIENEFKRMATKYPRTIECIPILIAIRSTQIEMYSGIINFKTNKHNIDDICVFMNECGLFKLLQNKNIKSLTDYLIGVEVGLDTNARKNRGGKDMSNKFEQFLINGNISYDKEMKFSKVQEKYGIIFPKGIKDKQFDFVFKINDIVYGVEVNFYSGGGSKLNETAKSYIELNNEFKNIKNFRFLWITDGAGWNSAKNDLEMAFKNMDHLYNLNNLKNGLLDKLSSWKEDIYEELDVLADEDSLLNKKR